MDIQNAFLRKLPVPLKRHGKFCNYSFVTKDNISVHHFPTSCGFSPPLIPSATATASVVDVLLKEGAGYMGATQLDPGAIGATAENPYYGDIQSTECEIFGSSAGAAAVVAQNQSDFALVTDIAGSARLPALSTGLYGIKLRSADVSHTHIVRYDETIDCLGILSRTATTLSEILTHLLPKQKDLCSSSKHILLDENEKHRESLPGSFSDAAFVRLADFPELQEILLTHKQIIALGVQNSFHSLGSRAPRELQALFHLQVETSQEALWEHREALTKSLSDHFSEPTLLLTPILRSSFTLDSGTAQIFPLANLLDWPAIIFPVTKKVSIHCMANTSSRELLSLLLNTE